MHSNRVGQQVFSAPLSTTTEKLAPERAVAKEGIGYSLVCRFLRRMLLADLGIECGDVRWERIPLTVDVPKLVAETIEEVTVLPCSSPVVLATVILPDGSS